MALPTLQPYYITKRNVAAPERVMVRRRVQQDEFKQRWSENSRYFNQADVEASKQKEWTSSKAFQESMGAYQGLIDKEEKVVRLRERREKLRRQLEQERALLADELQALELGPEDRLSQMKERAEDLKGAREEGRKKVAQEKLYRQWRSNNPEIRQLERKEHEKAVHSQWSEQVQDRERRQEEEEHVRTVYDEAMEQERREAVRKEKEEVTRKKREEKRVAAVLQSQMAEIKRREEEAALMEQERAGLLREQAELEKVEKERQQNEEARKKMELGRMLHCQAKAQLRRRSQQVQEELELDLRILEDLAVREAADQKVQTARKEKARADAEWMRQVVAEQLQLEKEREAQLDTMYQQEAARIWAKRDAEWEKERQARERLMKEVLAERQSQIEHKMDVLKSQQAESIERREELLREMEYAKQATARDVERRKDAVTSRERELRTQVMERQRRTKEAREQYERELQEQEEMERAYDELMQAEREAITARGHQPQSHRRIRQAWM